MDVLLLTEDDSPPEYTWYYEMDILTTRAAQTHRLPHDIHLGVVALGTALRHEGFSCEIIDNFRRLPSNARRLEELLARKPRVVGLSTTFLCDERVIEDVVAQVRRASPTSTIVFGGPTIRQFPEYRRFADVSVLMEGESTFPRLVRALCRAEPLDGVPGIEFWKDGRAITTPPAKLLDWGDILDPDWGAFGRGPANVYPFETQRGCVYKCRYCTYPIYSPGKADTSGVRLMPTARVLEVLRRNYERLGITCYRMADSTFTFPIKRAQEICEGIARAGLPLRWSCYGRVDNMTRELSEAMAAAGCRCIFFGIESGDEEMLRFMRKDFTTDDIHRGIAVTHAAGIASCGSFIVGYPGETERSLANTERCIMDTRFTFLKIGTFFVDRNAPIWGERAKWGLEGRGLDWRHATMDAVRAKEVTKNMLKRVLARNVSIPGSDYHIATLVGLGLDYDEGIRFLAARALLINRRLAVEECTTSLYDPQALISAREDFTRMSLRVAERALAFLNQQTTTMPT